MALTGGGVSLLSTEGLGTMEEQDGGLPCIYPIVEIRRMEGGQRQDGGVWGRTEEEDY